MLSEQGVTSGVMLAAFMHVLTHKALHNDGAEDNSILRGADSLIFDSFSVKYPYVKYAAKMLVFKCVVWRAADSR